MAALVSAIVRFPMAANQLANTLAIDVPPVLITSKRAQVDGSYTCARVIRFQAARPNPLTSFDAYAPPRSQPSYALSLLSELYAVRAGPLWKDPDLTAFLKAAIAKAAPSLEDKSNEDYQAGEKLFSTGPFPAGHAPAGVIRAAFISGVLPGERSCRSGHKLTIALDADAPSIRPYLPPSARSGTSYSFDPLPPTDPITTFYDDEYFAPLHGAAGARRRRQNPRLPGGGPGVRGGNGADAMAAMRDGLMRLLGMGADGPQLELNEEVRAELLEELAMLNAGGGMPGGLDDGDDEDEEDWEDDGEGGQPGEAAQGLLQRMAGMFGLAPGAPAEAAHTGTDGDDEHDDRGNQ